MNFFLRFTEGVIGTPSSRFYWKEIGKKMRLIGEPNDPMREIQSNIVDYLRPFAPKLHNATACKYGLGSVRNARAHSKQEFIFTLDFSDAFESVNGKILSEMIASRVAKYSPRGVETPTTEEWFTFLSLYALKKDGSLIQGAKTSSMLFDWYCEVVVDKPIRKLLFEYDRDDDIVYTRYADDLTFTARHGRYSKPNPITNSLKWRIREVINTAGFRENHRKTRVCKLETHGAVKVTGVSIGANDHVGIGRKETREIERLLAHAVEMPLFATNPNVVKGKVHYLLDVLRGKQELNQLEKRTLLKYIEWCQMNGIDSRWAESTLRNKPPKKIQKRRQKRKSKPK